MGVGAADLAGQLAGRLLLQAEKNGEIWYVEPRDLKRYYISAPKQILNDYDIIPLGITDRDLNKIEIGYGDFKLEKPKIFGDSRGWWGHVIAPKTPVKNSADSKSPNIGYLNYGDRIKVLEEARKDSDTWYKIDGGLYPGAYISAHDVMPYFAQPSPPEEVSLPQGIKESEYWIDADLRRNVLTLFKGNKPEFATFFSPGLSVYPTLAGTSRIYKKLEKRTMAGGPPQYAGSYYLPDVPFTMYYNGSYAIHGTYWHDRFGYAKSHGCTNLTQGDAEYIFNRVSEGTIVVNHY